MPKWAIPFLNRRVAPYAPPLRVQHCALVSFVTELGCPLYLSLPVFLFPPSRL